MKDILSIVLAVTLAAAISGCTTLGLQGESAEEMNRVFDRGIQWGCELPPEVRAIMRLELAAKGIGTEKLCPKEEKTGITGVSNQGSEKE